MVIVEFHWDTHGDEIWRKSGLRFWRYLKWTHGRTDGRLALLCPHPTDVGGDNYLQILKLSPGIPIYFSSNAFPRKLSAAYHQKQRSISRVKPLYNGSYVTVDFDAKPLSNVTIQLRMASTSASAVLTTPQIGPSSTKYCFIKFHRHPFIILYQILIIPNG